MSNPPPASPNFKTAIVVNPTSIKITEKCYFDAVSLTLKTTPLIVSGRRVGSKVTYEKIEGKPLDCSKKMECPCHLQDACRLTLSEYHSDGEKLPIPTAPKITPQTAYAIIAKPPYAVITSPFTIEAKEGCNICEEEVLTPIVLTLKTDLPIIMKAVRPNGGGKPRKSGVCGKPIACSNQKRCPSRKNKACLLNMETWDCDSERLPTSIFAEMTPLTLRRLIKSDGYELVHKKDFLLSAEACGMSRAKVWRVVKKYSPDRKDREQFLSKRRIVKAAE